MVARFEPEPKSYLGFEPDHPVSVAFSRLAEKPAVTLANIELLVDVELHGDDVVYKVLARCEAAKETVVTKFGSNRRATIDAAMMMVFDNCPCGADIHSGKEVEGSVPDYGMDSGPKLVWDL